MRRNPRKREKAHTFVPAGQNRLANMQDRIEAVGGSLTVESTPGQGTIVSGVVRLH